MKDKHPLKIVTERVLQDWAMMLVEPLELSAETFDRNEPVYMSWVDIVGDGALSGGLSIVAQKPFLQALATNLLGSMDPSEISDAECMDAFREMGNVLTGNFITEAYGEELVFKLLNPNVTTIPYSDFERFVARKVVFGFTGDDAPLAVTFSMKE